MASAVLCDPQRNGCVPNGALKDGNAQTKSTGPKYIKDQSVVMAPFNYLMAKPGKNFRRQLLIAFNVWLQVDETTFDTVDKVVEMLHNASLLIDDIQDGSQLRRGFPSAHVVFGMAQTINSANYVYFLAQQQLLSLRDSAQAAQIFNEELLNLHHGQGMELFWRDTLTIPSEAEYYEMISNKTGGLFRLAARLLQSVSSTPFNIVPLADIIGLIFQIRDDHQNLCSTKMTAEKGYCEDLTEGKFSFPIVHALRASASSNNELLQILKMHTEDHKIKAHAVWYLRTVTRSFDYARATLRDLHEQARLAIADIGPANNEMSQILAALELT